MVQNKGLIFKKVPQHLPVVGEHLDVEARDFDLDAAPPTNGITVKVYYVSFDPYQRGGMRVPDTETYFPPYIIGYPIWNSALGKVLKSDSSDFKEGDVVLGTFGTEEYSAVPPQMIPMVRPFFNPYSLDPKIFMGALGVAGLSAYSSMYDIAKPQKGETIFISAASGAVGQLVGQIAKIEGLTVIGSVGNDEKLEFITKELGFDAGFNYKIEKTGEALAKLAPKGLDIYYDNVGGEQLEAALDAMKDFGRIGIISESLFQLKIDKLNIIVGCGMISQYNTPKEQRYGIKNMMNLFLKRLSMQGFIVSDPHIITQHIADLQTNMGKWIAEGKVKTRESVIDGIDNAATGFLGMFEGANFGKTVLKIADLD